MVSAIRCYDDCASALPAKGKRNATTSCTFKVTSNFNLYTWMEVVNNLATRLPLTYQKDNCLHNWFVNSCNNLLNFHVSKFLKSAIFFLLYFTFFVLENHCHLLQEFPSNSFYCILPEGRKNFRFNDADLKALLIEPIIFLFP